MPKRFYNACLQRTAKAFAIAAALSFVAAPVIAQQSVNAPAAESDIAPPSVTNTEFDADNVDPVTRLILSDALQTLRFLAINLLEKPEDLGLAHSGVVRGYLARQSFDDAVRTAELIEDPLWRARSHIWLSDYVRFVKEDDVNAREWLNTALEIFSQIEQPRDQGETFTIIADRLVALEDLNTAVQIARQVPNQRMRMNTLLDIADSILAANRTPERLAVANDALKLAEEDAITVLGTIEERADLVMRIGAVLLLTGDLEGATTAFEEARRIIDEGTLELRHDLYGSLAERMVAAGNHRGGMAVVRLIPEGALRARALAAVAAVRGRSDIDAAVPLFRLANEEVQRITDQTERFDTIAYIVARQSEVGRLADAFEASAGITERLPQAEALLEMGRVLIAQGKLQEALVLKDYIPFVGMRAQVMAPVALKRGLENDSVGASALLSEALDPTGFPFQDKYIPIALDLVLEAQVKTGQPEADQAIFSRARDMAEILPDESARVAALVQLAIAEARRGRIDDAQMTISAAYRSAFEDRGSPNFKEELKSISLAQLAAGDLLGAYDTAARIPEPPPNATLSRIPEGGFADPRYQALIRVAAASGRLGDPRFGIDVTAKIGHEPARAVGLAAVAIAMANRTSDLIDVLDDIQSGDLLSPDYDYLTQAKDLPPEELVPLEEAESLAPLTE